MDTDIKIKTHTLIEENYIPKIEQRFQYFLQEVFNVKKSLPAITAFPSATKCDTGYPFGINCANFCTLRATAYPATDKSGVIYIDRFNISDIGNTSNLTDFIEDVAVHLAIKYLHSYKMFIEEAVLTFLQKEVGTTAISEILFEFLNAELGIAEVVFKKGVVSYHIRLGVFDSDGSRIINGYCVSGKNKEYSGIVAHHLTNVKGIENSVDIDKYVEHLITMYRMLHVLAIYPYKD